MRRTLEIILARWLQLAVMLIVPLSIGLAVVWVQPRSYEASANLWALGRYTVIGATGPESDLSSTPAATQATALGELMQTHEFALAVAKEARLDLTYPLATRTDPTALNDAMYADLNKNVSVTPIGVNVFTIVYTNRSPQVATQVVAAVINQYDRSAGQFSVAEGKQLLLVDQQQLEQAKNAATAATAAAATYQNEHPRATVQTDATYATLMSQAATAQQAVTNIQNSIDTLNRDLATTGGASNTLFLVVDNPAPSATPVSRKKVILEGTGIGAGVGILAIVLYLIIVMRRDRSPYFPVDLLPFSDAPVVLDLPFLSSKLVSQALDRPVKDRRRWGRGHGLDAGLPGIR